MKMPVLTHFNFFMDGVIEHIIITVRRVNEKLFKGPPEPAPIIQNLIKNRNVVLEGMWGEHDGMLAEFTLRELNPLDAYQEYGMRVYSDHLNNDEFISGHALLAYICAKLALRHHSRGHAERAAMYAHEALHSISFMCWCFPNELEDKDARWFKAIGINPDKAPSR